MSELTFFDANCQIGRFNFRIEQVPYSAGAAAQDAAPLGIRRRLVHHAMAKEHNVRIGNMRILDECRAFPQLAPCWAVSTWTTDETSAPDRLIETMKSAGVRAVRFFRHAYRVPMAEWSLGGLWTVLEQHQVPLFIDLGDRWATMDEFDPDEVHALCEDHPDLPIILVKHRIRYNRQVYQLMSACPNLRLELSGYWHYRAVEEICGRFGCHRLLFGTNWPYMDSSFAVAAVTYAQVSLETREAVAGGNLRALMEGVNW